METDAGFNHWLAGFIAGEGCFKVCRNHGCWVISFALSQRDDDAEIIYEIQERLQLGKVYHVKQSKTTKPKVVWQISRLDEQLRLIEILDQFPLRARKQKDYTIWREAVFAKSKKDFALIDKLVPQLKAARTYKVLHPSR